MKYENIGRIELKYLEQDKKKQQSQMKIRKVYLLLRTGMHLDIVCECVPTIHERINPKHFSQNQCIRRSLSQDHSNFPSIISEE